MPPLSDPRRETFAQAIHHGHSNGEAAKRAGYRSDARSAWSIRRGKEIASRIHELTGQRAEREARGLERAAAKYQVSADRVVAELARLAFANSLDYWTTDSNGEPQIDLSKVNRDKGAAISEIIVDTYMDGRSENARQVKRIRIKLHDKRAALVDLGKHLGLFVDPQTLNLAVNNFFSEKPPSLAEWKKEIELQANPPADVPADGQGQPKKLRVINGKA